MSLEIDHLSVTAGDCQLSGIQLLIPQGACAVIMGKSGVGKTTLMEAICGLRKHDSGGIFIAGRRVDTLRPGERQVGLVPQDGALFPHMNVREHLEFALKLQRWSKNNISERVDSLATALDLEKLLSRRPRGLSGGESKRVTIGRALAARPRLLCLDEAFTGLDDESSMEVIDYLKVMIKEENITTLNITHRKDEAKMLGGELYVLHDDLHQGVFLKHTLD